MNKGETMEKCILSEVRFCEADEKVIEKVKKNQNQEIPVIILCKCSLPTATALAKKIDCEYNENCFYLSGTINLAQCHLGKLLLMYMDSQGISYGMSSVEFTDEEKSEVYAYIKNAIYRRFLKDKI